MVAKSGSDPSVRRRCGRNRGRLFVGNAASSAIAESASALERFAVPAVLALESLTPFNVFATIIARLPEVRRAG
jgi:hypothetical protein